MSFRKLFVAYTRAARRDINDILYFTGREWGTDQRRKYRRQLRDAAYRLATMPSLGRSRDDLAFGLRSYPVGGHVHFYVIEPNALLVVRLLHSRQDATSIDWQLLSDESREIPGE